MRPLASLIACMWLASCATFSEPRYSVGIQQQDANNCAANPRPLPGCIFGVMFFGTWKF
jgi:hypothetical protein